MKDSTYHTDIRTGEGIATQLCFYCLITFRVRSHHFPDFTDGRKNELKDASSGRSDWGEENQDFNGCSVVFLCDVLAGRLQERVLTVKGSLDWAVSR